MSASDSPLTRVLLVGTGPMAKAYFDVLSELGVELLVVGRSQDSCNTFENETGVKALSGGIEDNTESAHAATHAIIAVGVKELASATNALIGAGIPSILVEKPGALRLDAIEEIAARAEQCESSVLIGYNRRFLASTLAAKALVADDGGAQTVSCDFTEMEARVLLAGHGPDILSRWFLANSTHVVDMALLFTGELESLHCQRSGVLPWHDAGARFAGCGNARGGALFNYSADWSSAGRWGVEVTTARRRLILQPLEQLFQQLPGSFEVTKVSLDDDLDQRFKPGLYLQVQNFLFENSNELLTARAQADRMRHVYSEMVPEPFA